MGTPTGRASRRHWGHAPTGEALHLFTLTLPDGVQATLTDVGATLVSLLVPDRHGALGDVVLGHDRPEAYLDRARSPYFGATIGRVANRIAGGRFTLDGRAYQVPTNDGPNALHGGLHGFDRRLWHGETGHGETVHSEAGTDPRGPSVTFSRLSPDGEEGFPGSLRVEVTYTLTPDHALHVQYRAQTDVPTVVNLTNHSYWNLTGDPAHGVLGHELTVQAGSFLPVRPGGLPTGEVRPVNATPFDFRTPHTLGLRIRDEHEQLRVVGGYDHTLVLAGGVPGGGPQLREVATLYDPSTGRALTLSTTEPGLQLYSGNFLDGSVTGKYGQTYARHAAVCLETQHFPDSPNQPSFPSLRLEPGQVLRSHTVHAFSARQSG
ncbi:aldose epimerase family protein [Deinococcus koreensis]|uniref:Aldose 1-epimerase n=1 Tax=Deinococcus koreensis TaxID=2054903 RepID=A0A2K3UYB7_9DEIO|nr:aldose epimerase family protein [Deinococcus koreensis]PNY81495.1 galactose-1-epimerase [Deinococcus koreensis]